LTANPSWGYNPLHNPIWEGVVPKINVYLSDDLASAVRDAAIPVSAVCQRALTEALSSIDVLVADPDSDAAASGEGLDTSRLTARARKVIVAARSAASRQGRTAGALDVVAELIEEGHNLALVVLASMDVEPADLLDEARAVEAVRRRDASISGPAIDPVGPGSTLPAIIERGAAEAVGLGHNYVGTEHLLLGFVSGPADDPVVAALRTMGADVDSMRTAVRSCLAGITYAQRNLYGMGVSAPLRGILDEIRLRLGRMEEATKAR
jgi:hypothetical protein